MIAIIDYQLGNVKAFTNIYKELGIQHFVAATAEELARAERVILPGVGAFDQAMRRLETSGMRAVLDDLVIRQKRPVLGVCVGMQMLTNISEEGSMAGLGWIDGSVLRFQQTSSNRPLAIPHMGWNDVQPCSSEGLFRNLGADARFYFLHSFYFRCERSSDVLATSHYGNEFSCAVARDNVLGVQFHPEKSHGWGKQLLQNFAEL